ncbi:hypothetical protein [Stappia sp.]|uniref:hypothetical protein n=1 Tax=Stappia sp. TaxID=1870903 RepID=UPI0032D95D4E
MPPAPPPAPPPPPLTIVDTCPADPGAFADAARRAFGRDRPELAPGHFAWKHRVGMPPPRLVSLMDGDRIVGSAAIVHRRLRQGDALLQAGELVDLFLVPEHRGFAAVRRLYAALDRRLRDAPASRAIYALPNPNSKPLNARFLKLADTLSLTPRLGIGSPVAGRHTVRSRTLHDPAADEDLAAVARWLEGVDGIAWTADALRDRLSSPAFGYALHRSDTGLLVSSPRRERGLPVVLVCAVFVAPGAPLPRADLRALLGAACRHHRRPLFVYVGLNRALAALPGHPLPGFAGGRAKTVQTRLAQDDRNPLRFDRFEALDCDLG